MKEKLLIQSFFAGNLADLAITNFAMQHLNFQELNGWAAEQFANGDPEIVSFIKIAATSCLILLFAYTKERDSRFAYSTEKTLQIGQVIVWTVVLLNMAQVAAELSA